MGGAHAPFCFLSVLYLFGLWGVPESAGCMSYYYAHSLPLE